MSQALVDSILKLNQRGWPFEIYWMYKNHNGNLCGRAIINVVGMFNEKKKAKIPLVFSVTDEGVVFSSTDEGVFYDGIPSCNTDALIEKLRNFRKTFCFSSVENYGEVFLNFKD